MVTSPGQLRMLINQGLTSQPSGTIVDRIGCHLNSSPHTHTHTHTSQKPMITNTRATYATVNEAHASTARVPLIRAEGIVLPAQQLTRRQPAPSLCTRVARAYRDALEDQTLRLPVTPELKACADRWLIKQTHKLRARRIRPLFIDEPVDLEVAIAALSRPVLPGEWITVPISTVDNNPHPVWDSYQNLVSRLAHDVAHHDTGADASFDGELAVLKHTLIEAQELHCYAFPHFLASEIIGQASYRITYGSFPQQIIARNILPLI